MLFLFSLVIRTLARAISGGPQAEGAKDLRSSSCATSFGSFAGRPGRPRLRPRPSAAVCGEPRHPPGPLGIVHGYPDDPPSVVPGTRPPEVDIQPRSQTGEAAA